MPAVPRERRGTLPAGDPGVGTDLARATEPPPFADGTAQRHTTPSAFPTIHGNGSGDNADVELGPEGGPPAYVGSGADASARPRSLLSSALSRRSSGYSRSGDSPHDADVTGEPLPGTPTAGASTAVPESTSSGAAARQLTDLASFEIDLELDAWRRSSAEFSQRHPYTMRFVDPHVEDEFLRFQMSSASPLAIGGAVLVAVIGMAIQGPALVNSLYGGLLFACTIGFCACAALTVALLRKQAALRGACRARARRASMDGNVVSTTDFQTERIYAVRHEFCACAVLVFGAAMMLFATGTAEERCADVYRVEPGTDAWLHTCRYTVHPAPFILATTCLLVFRVRYTHQVAFIVAVALAGGFGTLRFSGENKLPALQMFLMVLSNVVLTLAFLPLASMREKAMRTRFMLLVEVFVRSSQLEAHQENLWGIVRAVVPAMVLPRVRIAATGEAARIVDSSAQAVVSIAAVHNFGAWSMSLLPFNVVLSLSRLFIEFDRCLANVDAAVAGKAMITGDRYVVVGGVAAGAAITGSNAASQSASPLPPFVNAGIGHDDPEDSIEVPSPRRRNAPGAGDALQPPGSPLTVPPIAARPGDLLVAIDIGEEQVRLGAAIARQSPDVSGDLKVAVGVAAGEVHAGIAGRASLRYLVAGPGVDAAVRMLDAAGPGKVAATLAVRNTVENAFPDEIEWTRTDGAFGQPCFEARRKQRREDVPGLHAMVLGEDLMSDSVSVGNNHPDVTSASPLSNESQHDSGDQHRRQTIGSEPPEAGGSAGGASLLPPGVTGAPFNTHSIPGSPAEGSHPTQTPSPGLPSIVQHQDSPPTAQQPPPIGVTADDLASRGATQTLRGSVASRRESITSALMSQSSLISTATAEHRIHVADDHALDAALKQAADMLQRDPCSGRFVHDDVEESLMRYAAADDRDFGRLRAGAALAAVGGIVLLYLLDAVASGYAPWDHDHGGSSDNTTSTATATPTPEPKYVAHEGEGFGVDAIQGLALMLLGGVLCVLQFILALKEFLLPVPGDVALSAGICACVACACLLNPHNLMTVSGVYMIPVLSFCVLMNASRWPWSAIAVATVVAIAAPVAAAAIVTHEDANHVLLTLYAVAVCAVYSVAAAAVMWLLRSRFSAVLLAGEFLHLSRQRYAIREQLLKGLLPAHVIGPVGDTAEMPEEVRLMAERPHFLEVWEELVVVHIAFTAPNPDAPATSANVAYLGGSAVYSPGVPPERRPPNDFDIAVARLQDVQDAIATATGTPQTAGMLDVVEVVGTTVVVAGCVLPMAATPHYADPHMRAAAAARASVRFCQNLAARCRERKDAFISATVTESGYGAILGSQLLNYCVLGVARRTAATLHRNMPDFAPPGTNQAERPRSLAFVLDSLRRLCYRQRTGTLLPGDDAMASEGSLKEANPFDAVGATDGGGGGATAGAERDSMRVTVRTSASSEPFGVPVRCGVRGVGSVEMYPILLDGAAQSVLPGAVNP